MKFIYYKKYVNDIFAVFESESNADSFYSYLNTRHGTIKFILKNRKIKNFPF